MGRGTWERCKWLGGVGEKRNGERLGKGKHNKSEPPITGSGWLWLSHTLTRSPKHGWENTIMSTVVEEPATPRSCSSPLWMCTTICTCGTHPSGSHNRLVPGTHKKGSIAVRRLCGNECTKPIRPACDSKCSCICTSCGPSKMVRKKLRCGPSFGPLLQRGREDKSSANFILFRPLLGIERGRGQGECGWEDKRAREAAGRTGRWAGRCSVRRPGQMASGVRAGAARPASDRGGTNGRRSKQARVRPTRRHRQQASRQPCS